MYNVRASSSGYGGGGELGEGSIHKHTKLIIAKFFEMKIAHDC